MPDHLYVTALGIAGYVIFYVPVTLLIVFLLNKMFSEIKLWRVVLKWCVALIILFLPWVEIFKISFQAQQLCKEQAGMHIYKTVNADGFVGGGAINYWSHLGYKFVETREKNKLYRYTVQNGKEVKQEISSNLSKYHIQTGMESKVIGRYFSTSSDRVIDIDNQEVLGEIVTLFIYPSMLDSFFIAVTGTGSGFSPWQCGNEPPIGKKEKLSFVDVVLATLKPSSDN